MVMDLTNKLAHVTVTLQISEKIDTERNGDREGLCMCVCLYIYISICGLYASFKARINMLEGMPTYRVVASWQKKKNLQVEKLSRLNWIILNKKGFCYLYMIIGHSLRKLSHPMVKKFLEFLFTVFYYIRLSFSHEYHVDIHFLYVQIKFFLKKYYE